MVKVRYERKADVILMSDLIAVSDAFFAAAHTAATDLFKTESAIFKRSAKVLASVHIVHACCLSLIHI